MTGKKWVGLAGTYKRIMCRVCQGHYTIENEIKKAWIFKHPRGWIINNVAIRNLCDDCKAKVKEAKL